MLEDPEVRDGEQGEKLKNLPPIDTDLDLMEYIAGLDVRLFGFPGEHFSYSNDSYALLGSIIERVSGLPYETYVVESILKPLGMSRSLFATKDIVKMDNVATLYSSKKVKGKDKVYASPLWIESPAMSAAGFLKSTTSDMLRYMEIFRTGGTCDGARVLTQQSVDHMCAPFAQPQPGQFYGYGMMVHGNYRGVSLVEHGGNIKGVSAWVSCIREKGITGVSLTNLVSAPASELLLTALNTTLGAPLKNPRYAYKPYACSKESLKQYEGQFISGEGAALTVTAKGSGLEISLGEDKLFCGPISLDTFAMERKGQKLPARFLRNTAGEIWALATGFRIIPKAPKA
jgi:CubicO group peptidase (beta-lactamase class C family)